VSPTNERLVYERALPATPRSVALVRGELRAALDRERIDATRCYDISLVLSEAAGNAVLHAYPPRPPGLLFVDAAVTDHHLLLRVCDCGRGLKAHADRPGLGLGLPLMGRLSDGLEIAPNRTVRGTRVSAVFHDVLPEAHRPARVAARRGDGVALDEYVAALGAASAELRENTRALLAEAQQAIDQSQRLRAERGR
jgi:anti-sigma regulatory factor (Ser/Thr protein kinase)